MVVVQSAPMKLFDPDWSLKRDRYVLARLAEGASWQQIADELDVTRQRVRQIVHQARIRRNEAIRKASSLAEFYYTERFGPKR